ncbi:MAG TPA: hypothetical protein VGN74_12855 [Brevundimonas sp.]|jgi:high-affinity Fe2+/Pb2+ permease|uniref:hypothetical protein n=1 Tax=Brevundimonas sp. TaxID=1871086 RepID=UPI002E154BF0|nr:hypothetical protein [Brevundimonas sp.]
MATQNGRGAVWAAGVILLVVAALNLAYGLYRTTQGLELNTAQLAMSAAAAGIAAVLLSRGRKSGG